MAELVDAHCHFDFAVFDGQREAILEGAKAGGIRTLVVPGVSPRSWASLRRLASAHDAVRYAPGIHPWWVGESDSWDGVAALEYEISDPDPRMVAIGECGLDFLRDDHARQMELFRAQIRLAERYGYPLLIHSVRSHDEVGALLRREGFSRPTLVHGFSGSKQQAVKLMDRGAYIGVGGVITHERARKTRETIQRLPAESLVLETDAPDMPPAGVRKGHNSPLNLTRVFETLCELRGADPESLSSQILANTERLFMGRLNAEGLHGEGASV